MSKVYTPGVGMGNSFILCCCYALGSGAMAGRVRWFAGLLALRLQSPIKKKRGVGFAIG